VGGDILNARKVLEKALVAKPESEAIWLAAVKLGAARELLTRARTVVDTERVIWPAHTPFPTANLPLFPRYG
jgi:pre-mRNA-processing factor 6